MVHVYRNIDYYHGYSERQNQVDVVIFNCNIFQVKQHIQKLRQPISFHRNDAFHLLN